ncbi:MAG TPA: glycosyltransferase family 61 protein [Niabella sp.]|nr:glycosyltransferase family 61 protein [Niabella sp.]
MSLLKQIIKTIIKKIWGISPVNRAYWNFRGFSLLSAEATIQFLEPYCIKIIPESSVDLPDVQDENNPGNRIYKAYTFTSGEVHVWQHELKNGFISKHGSVVIGNKVLCTDWDHRGFEHKFWEKDKRLPKFVPKLIPLLSHHQDIHSPVMLTGYYDFVLMVAAKLSRIKDALSDEDLRDITITYHSFGGHYEKQYLKLLGFDPGCYIDSRTYKLSAEKVIFGDCGTWKPNVNEILSLKRNIESRLNISDSTPCAGNRIYISRKGRREIENEGELIELLKEFDFIIIEDRERSVEEQINIYRNASFIIGPHGASFANIIWCKPRTYLYELFSKSWAPDYFLYLATINNMQYAAYQDDTHKEITDDSFKALCQDIYVSIPELRTSLEKILGKNQSGRVM